MPATLLPSIAAVHGGVKLAMFVENPAAFSTLAAQYKDGCLFVCLNGYGGRALAEFANTLASMLPKKTPMLVWHDHDMAGFVGTGLFCERAPVVKPFFCSERELSQVPTCRFRKERWSSGKEDYWRKTILAASWSKRKDMAGAIKHFARTHMTFEQEAVLDGTAQRILDEVIAARLG